MRLPLGGGFTAIVQRNEIESKLNPRTYVPTRHC